MAAGDIGAGTVILTLVGIGIIVVLGMLLIEMRSTPAEPAREVIVERRVPTWGWRGYGPYYSHLPLRPLVY